MMNKLVITLGGLMLAGMAGAKLPTPTEEAQAAATEAKNKAAWADKVAAYQLCRAQDKVAAHYQKTKGSEVKTAAATTTAPATPAAVPGAAATTAAAPAPATAPATASSAAAPAPAIPPCQDPGPYVAAQAAAKVGVADSLPVPAAGKPPATAAEKK
jgi:hypothetical protein